MPGARLESFSPCRLFGSSIPAGVILQNSRASPLVPAVSAWYVTIGLLIPTSSGRTCEAWPPHPSSRSSTTSHLGPWNGLPVIVGT
eukprot:scaffold866_cov544-Prasinococcus_capsulatus_cf.AAC.5